MLDVEAALHLMEGVVRDHRTLADGLPALMAGLGELAPDPVWERFASAPTEREVEDFRAWLRGVVEREPPPRTLRAYWFGLFDATPQDETEPGTILYLSGAGRFDPEDPDWAVDPVYFPDDRYAAPDLLWTLSTALGRAGEEARAVAPLATLGHAALLVKEGLRPLGAALVPGRAAPRPVAVGHDEGDHVLLGALSPLGWSDEPAQH